MIVFTPENVSAQLKQKSKKEKSDRKTTDNTAPVQVQVNAGDLLGTFWSMCEHFDKRRRARRMKKRRVLKSKVLHLAEHYQGLVGIPDLLMNDWCDREEAHHCFQDLQAEGHCHFFTTYQGEELYVFPNLVVRVWHCDFCNSYYSARKTDRPNDVCTCTNCGARLQLTLI